MRRLRRLYHLAEESNIASILANGLLSTERLMSLAGISGPRRLAMLRSHRQDNLKLSDGIVIRDQRPMPPALLAPALLDGLEPADWYEILNGFVFMWPDRNRMARQRSACGNRPQVVLTFDAETLLHAFESNTYVSPINSGNARRKPALRGRGTLVAYSTWSREGWPSGQRTRPPAEILLDCSVPAAAPYLVDVAPA